jgi:hypothetical protein
MGVRGDLGIHDAAGNNTDRTVALGRYIPAYVQTSALGEA